MSLLQAPRYRHIFQLSTYNATEVRGRFNYYFPLPWLPVEAHCSLNSSIFLPTCPLPPKQCVLSSNGEFTKCLAAALCYFAWETGFGCSGVMPLHLLCEWKKEATGSEDSLAFLSNLWACLLATPANNSEKARTLYF